MISRRRGSAIALKTSVVVAARAMPIIYSYIGMFVKPDFGALRSVPQFKADNKTA
jgi:hypothetical protein